jgi:hypothetical protein
MKITITKGKNRNMLTCERKDGSKTSAAIGADIPNHDIAHFVVETKFKLENGFYGKIKSGMTIAELSNKEVIKNLGMETWLSEIMARNLQSISSGASTIEQYIELVNWETKIINGIEMPNLNLTIVEEIKSDFEQLCKKWNSIPENGQLNLVF